jgi:hypothetical protein
MTAPNALPITVLRVAATWGTTVLSVKNLLVGESYILGDTADASMVMPDGLTASSAPVRAVASGWELDARGVTNGLLRLRGREEDPRRFVDAPVVLMPGDWGLLQYGAFSVFFQFGPAPPPLLSSGRSRHRQLDDFPRRFLRARTGVDHAPAHSVARRVIATGGDRGAFRRRAFVHRRAEQRNHGGQ